MNNLNYTSIKKEKEKYLAKKRNLAILLSTKPNKTFSQRESNFSKWKNTTKSKRYESSAVKNKKKKKK